MVVEIDVSSRIIARDTESTVGQGIQHGVGAQPQPPRSLSQVAMIREDTSIGQGIQHGVGAQPQRPRSLSQFDYYAPSRA